MRTWIWLKHSERCGGCGAQLPEGSAAHEISLRGVKRRKYRGECCAGQAPPALPDAPMLTQFRDENFWRRLEALKPATRGEFKAMAKEYLPHPDD